jgi:hypothetical protein
MKNEEKKLRVAIISNENIPGAVEENLKNHLW